MPAQSSTTRYFTNGVKSIIQAAHGFSPKREFPTPAWRSIEPSHSAAKTIERADSGPAKGQGYEQQIVSITLPHFGDSSTNDQRCSQYR